MKIYTLAGNRTISPLFLLLIIPIFIVFLIFALPIFIIFVVIVLISLLVFKRKLRRTIKKNIYSKSKESDQNQERSSVASETIDVEFKTIKDEGKNE